MNLNIEGYIIEPLIQEDGVTGGCILPQEDTVEEERLIPLLRGEIAIPQQTHSLNVREIDNPLDCPEETDALITFCKNVAIGVKTADCVPILVYAPDVEGVAAIHAGWRGTLGGIVDKTIDRLIVSGADPAKMSVAFGPSVCKEAYEVDETLAQQFRDAGFGCFVNYPESTTGKPHIDLQGVNVERFLLKGVKRENIKPHLGCSYASRKNDGSFLYQSHRRSGGKPGRMVTFIKMGSL